MEFDPVKGSEQGGLRPALVIQNAVGNRNAPTTIVAAITSQLPPRDFPFVVVIQPEESGLPRVSAVNCAQLATIQQSGPVSRFRNPPGEDRIHLIGRLGPESLAKVDQALRFSLGLT